MKVWKQHILLALIGLIVIAVAAAPLYAQAFPLTGQLGDTRDPQWKIITDGQEIGDAFIVSEPQVTINGWNLYPGGRYLSSTPNSLAPAGVTRYRAHFSVPDGQAESFYLRGFLLFDDQAQIYINGVMVHQLFCTGCGFLAPLNFGRGTGTWPHSYSPFRDGDNVIEIQITNTADNTPHGFAISSVALGGSDPEITRTLGSQRQQGGRKSSDTTPQAPPTSEAYPKFPIRIPSVQPGECGQLIVSVPDVHRGDSIYYDISSKYRYSLIVAKVTGNDTVSISFCIRKDAKPNPADSGELIIYDVIHRHRND